jgi:hypothetical protein
MNRRSVLFLVVLGLLAGAVMIVRLRPSAVAGKTPNPQPAPALTAAERAARADELARRLQGLDESYAAALRAYGALRKEALSSDTSALAREVEAARRALEEAIDRHPAIVALRQELTSALDRDLATGVKQAEVLTRIRARSRERVAAFQATSGEILRAMDAELRAAGLMTGEGPSEKLSEADARRRDEIRQKHRDQLAAAEKAHREYQPSPEEAKDQQTYQEMGAARKADQQRYKDTYQEIPVARARVRADDPALAALDRVLTEKTAQWRASLQARPDLAASKAEVDRLLRERAEVRSRLGALRAAPAQASQPPAAAAAGTTNG